MESLGPLIFLALVVVFIWWSFNQGQPGAIAFEVPRDPSDIVMAALQSFSRHGWATTSQSDQSVTFSRSQAPGCLITGFLLLFGIIPGLLYWIAAKRTLTVSVVAQPDPSGRRRSFVNVAWSRNGGGRGPSLEFQQLLAPGGPITTASVPPPSVLADQIEDVTGGALSARQLERMSPGEGPMGQVASGPEGSVCVRCGRADLDDRERSRNPVLCDACLTALQAV